MSERRKKILIVDDDVTTAAFIGQCLREVGHAPLLAHNVSDAINLAISQEPACVLLDCHIGERDSGLALIKPLWQIVPDAPIVMISADTSWDLAADALRRGAFVFWRKTKGSVDLLEAVSVALEEHAMRRSGVHIVTLDDIERQSILDRLRANRGNLSQTARDLGRSLNSISELMRKHGIPQWQI